MEVQFSGIDTDREEKELLNELSEKFCKGCHGIESLHVNVKEHRKAGNRSKYTVQVRAKLPRVNINTAEATDWEFEKAARGAFDKLSREIKKDIKY